MAKVKYVKSSEDYKRLVKELNKKNPDIVLGSEYASFISSNMLQLLIRLSRYKFVARMLKKNDRILEVGSGSGLGALFLSQHCASVIGLEVKENEVAEAERINRRKNVSFIKKDFLTYEPAEKFDVVVSLDVIEHMPKKKGRELVKAMKNVLKNTGMVIIGTPSRYSYKYQSPLSKAGHVKLYTQDELVALMEESYGRVISFSMNDEMVHTGFSKLAWYYFALAFCPKN